MHFSLKTRFSSYFQIFLFSLFVLGLVFVTDAAFCSTRYPPSIVDDLLTQPVESMIPMKIFLKAKGYQAEFFGDVYYVTLKGGTKAVFKAKLPDDQGNSHAEVAAYNASVFLGFPNVPPTVIRTFHHKIGSLQLYIEPTVDALRMGVYKKALKQASKKEVANLKLFYFVFGQWDTGAHNILIKKDKNRVGLVAIDNSGIRYHQHVRYGELPFVRFCSSNKSTKFDSSDHFPFDSVKIIQKRTPKNLHLAFGNTLPKHIFEKLGANPEPLHYVVYKNSLWIQFHKNDPGFIIPHTQHYPEKSILALKRLHMAALKKIFIGAKGSGHHSEFLTHEFLQSILERRDQVLADYTIQSKLK